MIDKMIPIEKLLHKGPLPPYGTYIMGADEFEVNPDLIGIAYKVVGEGKDAHVRYKIFTKENSVI